MKLYLARHGDFMLTDIYKPGSLSEKGIQNLQREVQFLKPLELTVANIYHSGKVRAQESADILATAILSAESPQVYPGLNPEDDVLAFATEIVSAEQDVLIVGHLPFMGKLAAWLVTKDEHNEVVDFKTGTLVCLEQVMMDKWVINWVLAAELFES